MKPMMCFDVDGTIRGITDEHIVYDSTILALKKLKEAGYPIVVYRWQGLQESNPYQRFWRPMFYHWTKPLS